MGLPTKTTRSPLMPSAARLTSPSGAVTKSGSASRSVTRRLTSSGIVTSKERSPASTWATGMSSLAQTSAAASVRVDVAVDDDACRLQVDEARLERGQQRRRLRCVAAGADPEVHVRLGQAELLEEDVRQAAVVVLARVDEALLDGRRPERGDDGRGLDEVRPRADDMDEPGHAGKDATSARVGEP